jgi:hypothetical protein
MQAVQPTIKEGYRDSGRRETILKTGALKAPYKPVDANVKKRNWQTSFRSLKRHDGKG